MQERLEEFFHNNGEAPDSSAQRVIRLARIGVDKSVTYRKKYQKFIGTTAVVATAAYLTANFAINNLLKAKPESTDEEIISNLTDERLEAADKEFSKASKLAKAKRTFHRAAGSLTHFH